MRSASIQPLYDAIATGRLRGFTVPAFNLRGLVEVAARAVFRAARKLEAGAFIFEISRGEMSYTGLRPRDFADSVGRAARGEGWTDPVFLQGDHFQFDPRGYAADPAAETEAVKALTREAVAAGFLNIDIDPSTLVVLDRPTLREQQRTNFERSAELTGFIRTLQPPGVDISVGGEIGEVGKSNSTVEEFEAFFEGYRELWKGKPISKMSVQAGTEHGGTVLPDGTRARVAVDFEVHRRISEACRRRGLGGTVQHGASTLPEELFPEFPRTGCIEIHLATELQRTIFNHPSFPGDLRRDMESWVTRTRPPEWKETQTPAQNLERSIKRAWGPFRERIDRIPTREIQEALEEKIGRYLTLLGASGTRGAVANFVEG
ncbi:MAG TPA: class II fructose-bisphosphate aldolase [Planctomycetota bacterium]|nr:class II fructose-bisphosphate aldolase [Planctomycetota bacterium]